MKQIRAEKKTPEPINWKVCTSAGSRQDTLRQAASMSFVEKVAWLEAAETIAHRFRVTQQKPRNP